MSTKKHIQDPIFRFHFINFQQMESCELREYIRELEAHIRLMESHMEKQNAHSQFYENELSRTCGPRGICS
jgi:hypothetical protein